MSFFNSNNNNNNTDSGIDNKAYPGDGKDMTMKFNNTKIAQNQYIIYCCLIDTIF